MEDFLDHSYGTMLDAELSRREKRLPTINHETPRLEKDSVLSRLWEF